MSIVQFTRYYLHVTVVFDSTSDRLRLNTLLKGHRYEFINIKQGNGKALQYQAVKLPWTCLIWYCKWPTQYHGVTPMNHMAHCAEYKATGCSFIVCPQGGGRHQMSLFCDSMILYHQQPQSLLHTTHIRKERLGSV